MGRGKWGLTWTPDQVAAWFAIYSPIIVGYARLADETKVDAFHVGHELHALLTNASNAPHWSSLVKQVRAVYSGKVSVAFNGNPFFGDLDRGGACLPAPAVFVPTARTAAPFLAAG